LHEFSIVQSICEHAQREAEQHGATRVLSITCRVGVMRQLVPELMETAFSVLTEGTPMEGATLILETEGVHVACSACGMDTVIQEIPYECPACGSHRIRCRGGQDIVLMSLEAEQEERDGDQSTPAA
jgi:hydrogenase nickel incorporation protein HypA/HybF